MASIRSRRGWNRAAAVVAVVLLGAATAVAQPLGDVNCDAVLDAGDLATLPEALFDGAGDACGTADAGGDGAVSAADCVSVVHMLAAPTPSPAGPVITYLGLAGANGGILRTIGEVDGIPVFFRTSGSGFTIVVEGRVGASGVKPGERTFNPLTDDSAARPAIQLESRNPLGEGSPIVCDGGVPGMNPPDFGPGQAVTDVLNDMACHATVSTVAHSGCTIDAFDSPAFASRDSELQFCLPISGILALPGSDTLLAVRLVDLVGNPGPLRRMIVRVGAGPHPATFTPTRSPTPAPPTAVATRTPTRSAVPTGTFTRTPTRTRSAALVATSTPTPTPRTGVATVATPVPPTDSPRPSQTATPTQPTPTRVPTQTTVATVTRTRSSTPTHTASPVPSPTATPKGPSGPLITFMGLANSADELVKQSGETPARVPVYERTFGRSFSLVIEASPGSSGLPVGCLASPGTVHPTCDSFPGESPLADLQVVVSRPLGNGSPDVCDASGARAGGVPAVDPPTFDATLEGVDAINDLSCRFVDGGGAPVGRGALESCVQFDFEDSGFVHEESTIQFCAPITRALEFPPGETLVSARLRDVAGNLGPVGQMLVRIGP